MGGGTIHEHLSSDKNGSAPAEGSVATIAPFSRNFRRTVTGTIYLAGQPLLLNAISIPALAFVIRRLGASGYGEWTTATSLVATVAVLSNLGLRGIFIRSAARDPSAAPDLVAQQLGVRAILTLCAMSIAVGISVALHYPRPILECTSVAAFGLLFSCISQTFIDLMQSFENFRAIALTNLVAGLALTGASVLAVGLHGGPVAVAGAYLCGPIVSTGLLGAWLARSGFPVKINLNLSSAAGLIRECKFFTLQQILVAINTNLTLLALPKFTNLAEFGLFSAGALLVTRIAIIPDAIGAAAYPIIARSYKSDRQSTVRYVAVAMLFAVVACIGIAGAAFLAAPFIAHVLFPRDSMGCEGIIRITIWSLPVVAIEMIITYAMNASCKDAAQARASLLASITNIPGGIGLIWFFGVHGACWFMIFRPVVQIVFTSVVIAPRIVGDMFALRRLRCRDAKAVWSVGDVTTRISIGLMRK
jgi:O-antigen/teichoic acid export membrane protein